MTASLVDDAAARLPAKGEGSAVGTTPPRGSLRTTCPALVGTVRDEQDTDDRPPQGQPLRRDLRAG
ncbi:hypothetical protein QJS66_12865 [Kocuria rhizophila]|nr:hypothetical protein QJS66_12865 [Kocuria rhizophila]